MLQSWRDLLFLHWRFDRGLVQASLPEGLSVDTFDGDAYVGIVPFSMRNVRPAYLPPVPYLSNFLELNLRTYVYDRRGVPGVWFYSLDADRAFAVAIARSLFGLPYHRAAMRASDHGPVRTFTSRRIGTDRELAYTYRRYGEPRMAQPGTLDYFLVERYVLFSYSCRSRILREGRVHHAPYIVQDVDLLESDAGLFDLDGLRAPNRPPDHALASSGVDVEIFGLEAVDRASS